jgi:hypothetical protein
MRQVLSIICLLIGICFLGMAPASGAPSPFGEKCDSEVGIFDHRDYREEARSHRRGLNQIGILRISPSQDPWLLFEEFAKRLSVVAVDRNPEDWPPRDVRSIIKTKGGDRDELAFVLLNLFTANEFETELVSIYRNKELLFLHWPAARVLVYLPAIDRVFDPTLPPADQHQGPGQALLNGEPRIHRGYPAWRSAYNCPGSPIRAYRGKCDSDAVPAKTEPK